jgi:hypothetical protein
MIAVLFSFFIGVSYRQRLLRQVAGVLRHSYAAGGPFIGRGFGRFFFLRRFAPLRLRCPSVSIGAVDSC